MRCYRISKYNPQYIQHKEYLREQWTDYSDIGKVFDGKILTKTQYILVEDEYISCVISIMQETGIEKLCINDFENYSNTIWKNHKNISLDILPNLLRDCLRNNCWCKLKSNNTFVHFGYDYYIYIGTCLPECVVRKICDKHNLFCNEQLSPYS